MIILLGLLMLFVADDEKRGYLATFLSVLLSVPLGVFSGVLGTSTICGQSSTAYCQYYVYLTVPIIVLLGYFMLLVVGSYILKLQRHTPYGQSA